MDTWSLRVVAAQSNVSRRPKDTWQAVELGLEASAGLSLYNVLTSIDGLGFKGFGFWVH